MGLLPGRHVNRKYWNQEQSRALSLCELAADSFLLKVAYLAFTLQRCAEIRVKGIQLEFHSFNLKPMLDIVDYTVGREDPLQ